MSWRTCWKTSGKATDEVEGPYPEERDRGEHYEHDGAGGHEQVVDEKVGEVGQQTAAKNPLGSEREQLLERHEHAEEHGDPDDCAPAGHDRKKQRGGECQQCHHASMERQARVPRTGSV